MKILDDNKLKKQYIQKYNIDRIFSKDISEKLLLIEFEKNELLCQEGCEVNNMMFIVRGRAKTYLNLKNGKALLICVYDAPQVMGDLELSCSCKEASSTMQAIENTHCIALPFDAMNEEMLCDPKLLNFVCNSLAEKLKKNSKNSTINLLYPLENRLASYLNLMSTDGIFSLNLTETSEMLGTSYRHLLRVLDKFCKIEYIKKCDNYYAILNYEALEKLASDVYRY